MPASKAHTVYVEIADMPQVKAAMESAAARIRELEADVAALLEALSFTGYDLVLRFWPEYEGWAGSLQRSEACHVGGEANGCHCCAPFSISARAADLIDPPCPGQLLPDGWRSVTEVTATISGDTPLEPHTANDGQRCAPEDEMMRVAEAGDRGPLPPVPESAYPPGAVELPDWTGEDPC